MVPFQHILTTTALLSALLTHAQHPLDPVDLGGGDDVLFEAPACDPYTHGEWSAEDSLRFIPAHALYGSWETDAIFLKEFEPTTWADTVTLELTHSPCDHSMPVCGEINSTFGPRHGRMHYGVDLDLETGDPVVAAFEGMVRIARAHRTFGNVIVLRHANGLETLYAHLSRIDVVPGAMVEAGASIGLGGSTGRSTGSHLHFEVRYLGQPIDPQRLFDLSEGVLYADALTLHKGIFAGLGKSVKPVNKYHVVRKGDTLSMIARRTGTSVKSLCKVNRIRPSSTLRIGQRIRLG
ncbi:MAG: peptidoglycan DD-metalloendopeptidase family protein [Flavobacteriales bacterium]|nr:peptidoglycan DD-metalloendopeptidase family protein [Flavobacteriales bacterium]